MQSSEKIQSNAYFLKSKTLVKNFKIGRNWLIKAQKIEPCDTDRMVEGQTVKLIFSVGVVNNAHA